VKRKEKINKDKKTKKKQQNNNKKMDKKKMIAAGAATVATLMVLGTTIPIALNQAAPTDYRDTKPSYWSFQGFPSYRLNGSGWINPSPLDHSFIYDPNFILDINQCLSRSLHTRLTGYHHRLSLCRNTDPGERSIRIQLHYGNDHGDVSTGGKYGVSLSYDEYVSLVAMHAWVRDWTIRDKSSPVVRSDQIPLRKWYTNGTTQQPSTTDVGSG
jgi:hypothetical protein